MTQKKRLQHKNVVVKIGSSVLAPDAKLDTALLGRIVDQLCKLIDAGVNVTLVCSGAIACGIEALKLTSRPKEINKLQALAAIGQGKLMHAFEKASMHCGKHCAQILLVRGDVDDPVRYGNAKRTFNELHSLGILPVVNENDTTSTEEINFGDNDTLSAIVAGLVGADLLVVLSNVDGFLDQGKVVPEVSSINKELLAKVVIKESQFTKGGMESKLSAIGVALSLGVKVMLTNGRTKDVVTRIVLDGEHVGTLFHAQGGIDALKRR
jgi:glutamate 5-kinase